MIRTAASSILLLVALIMTWEPVQAGEQRSCDFFGRCGPSVIADTPEALPSPAQAGSAPDPWSSEAWDDDGNYVGAESGKGLSDILSALKGNDWAKKRPVREKEEPFPSRKREEAISGSGLFEENASADDMWAKPSSSGAVADFPLGHSFSNNVVTDRYGHTSGLIGEHRLDLNSDKYGSTTGRFGDEHVDIRTDKYGVTTGYIGKDRVDITRDRYGNTTGYIGSQRIDCTTDKYGTSCR